MSEAGGSRPVGDGPSQSYSTTRDGVLTWGPGATPPAESSGIVSAAVDKWVLQLATAAPEVAVVAVGGYGRSELCLYSDIDLLLLHEGAVREEAVRAVLYPLWDSGIKVGHATRTVKATLNLARDDLATLC